MAHQRSTYLGASNYKSLSLSDFQIRKRVNSQTTTNIQVIHRYLTCISRHANSTNINIRYTKYQHPKHYWTRQMYDTLKVDLYATQMIHTSLIGNKKFFVDTCGLQPIMNTSPWLQPIMDNTYPTGPNQLWAPKENSEPQPIMSTQKKTTSPNQLWALKTSDPNQLWAPRDYECMHATHGY